jgi:hypothetical protein
LNLTKACEKPRLGETMEDLMRSQQIENILEVAGDDRVPWRGVTAAS